MSDACGIHCSGQHPGYTEGVVTSMSVEAGSPTVVKFGRRRTDHGRARGGTAPLPLPDRCMLSHVLLECVTEGGELTLPSTVTWWLTADAKGNAVLTDRVTSPWCNSEVANQGGGVSARIDQLWLAGLQSDELHLWLYALDDSSIEVRPRVSWYTLSDLDLTLEHRQRIAELAGG